MRVASSVFALFAFLLLSTCSAAPNVVFVMADDVGLGDIGYYHRERTGEPPVAPTPNLDALAAAGMRFSDAHSTTALCSPTRYGAMSGNLNHRSYAPWGVWQSFRPSPFTERDATLGRVARRAGMATAFLGKWHLGGDFSEAGAARVYRGNDHDARPSDVDASRIVSGGPRSVGFDYSYTLPCGVQGPLYAAYENGVWAPMAANSRLIHYTAETAADPAYVSDKGPGVGDSAWDTRRIGPLLADKAEAFITRHAAAAEPFFLCYWSPAVHLPHLPPEEFDGVRVRGATPSRHLDMLIDLDQQIGRIVEALKRSGVYEDTLMIFSSDNGGLTHIKRQRKLGHDSAGGYRGGKNLPFEGGHRVPFFATWPNRIKAGSESAAMVGVHDVVATLAAAAGSRLEADQAMDSQNLLPLLVGDERFRPRGEMLLQGGTGHELIYRQGPWKLIIDGRKEPPDWRPLALFNLDESPDEAPEKNLLADPGYTSRVEEMFDRYRKLRASGERTVPLAATN